MAQDNCQKIKLLKLLELLRQETDEQHPLTTMDICNRLGAMGISCERRTLSKDVALLNEQGYLDAGKTMELFYTDEVFAREYFGIGFYSGSQIRPLDKVFAQDRIS